MVFPVINTNAFPSELDGILISGWGSFNGASNSVVLYPIGQTPFQPTQVHLQLTIAAITHDLSWPLPGRPYERFVFQTTTNLADWTTLSTLTNSGAGFDYQFGADGNEPMRFFRTARSP